MIQINVDELRRIAILSTYAAAKMEESNSVINTVISKHDWKCPERVAIDESLELIKGNSNTLNNTFEDFSSRIVLLANDFTDYINLQIRDDAESDDDIASVISELACGGVTHTVSGGSNFSSIKAELKISSMSESSFASLHGSSHGINILDFSAIDDGA